MPDRTRNHGYWERATSRPDDDKRPPAPPPAAPAVRVQWSNVEWSKFIDLCVENGRLKAREEIGGYIAAYREGMSDAEFVALVIQWFESYCTVPEAVQTPKPPIESDQKDSILALRERVIHVGILPVLGALDRPIESMSSLELAQRIADGVMPLVRKEIL